MTEQQTDTARQEQTEPRGQQNQNAQQNHGAQASQGLATTSRGELQRRGAWPNDPFTTMQRLSEEMDGLFENFGLRPLGFGRRLSFPFSPGAASRLAESGQALWSPQIEVFERDNQLKVRADLPGLKKEDVNIDIEDDNLVIQGERKSEHEEKREGFYRSERSYGSFCRTIPLPEGVNPDEVKANFENGVLEVTIPTPQQPERQSRRIEIQ